MRNLSRCFYVGKIVLVKRNPPIATPIPKVFCSNTLSKNLLYCASNKKRELSNANVLNVVKAPRNSKNNTGKYAS